MNEPRAVSFGAGAGTPPAGAADPRTGAGMGRTAGTASWASAWPQFRPRSSEACTRSRDPARGAEKAYKCTEALRGDEVLACTSK
jgi:hypothetical protein